MTGRRYYCIAFIIIILFSFVSCSYSNKDTRNTADNTKEISESQENGSDIENTDFITGIADNEPISSTSPDGFTIEMYGTDSNITAGGSYPYKSMRLINYNDNSVKWSLDFGYCLADFIWSDDSRYVVVNGTARNYSESFIVDTQEEVEITLPEYKTLSSYCDELVNLDSDYSNLYLSVSDWNNNNAVVVEFHGMQGTKTEGVSGTFTYDISSKTILDYQDSKASAGIEAETDSVKQEEPIIWYADITQDGIDEKIVVDVTYVINYPKTGEEQTVAVYSGSSGELLWTGHADTVHPGWNGIYIYNDGKKDYMLLWQPTVYQDSADFHFRIFSLDEDGKEIEFLKKNIQFDIYHPKDGDTDTISEFVDMVSGYLEKSYVLVDTDNGTPVYSTADNKIMNLYDVSWILEEIKETEENNQ